MQRDPAAEADDPSQPVFRGQGRVEAEGPALTEAAEDDPLTRDPGLHLSLDEAVDIGRRRPHPSLVLRPLGVEGLEVKPGRHHDPGVEADRHLAGARADELHAAWLDVGDLRSPAMARVSEAVEEDDSGRVLRRMTGQETNTHTIEDIPGQRLGP